MSWYKARVYSPVLGRFMQTDPAGYGDGPNWYAYVHNDPINGIDPTRLTDLSGLTVFGSHSTDSIGPTLDIPSSSPGFAEGNSANQSAEQIAVLAEAIVTAYVHHHPGAGSLDGATTSPQSNGRNCSVAPAGAGQYAAATAESVAMTAQFFSGLGDASPTFGPGSATSQVMGQSAGVQAALGQYQSTGATSGLYSFGLSGLGQAGANPVAQFVGSFRWSISGNTLSVTNTSSFKSLAYDHGPQWQRSQFAPMGNTHQTYNIQIGCH
jgi:uncharacterized protein RhaS with RHS repeats